MSYLERVIGLFSDKDYINPDKESIVQSLNTIIDQPSSQTERESMESQVLRNYRAALGTQIQRRGYEVYRDLMPCSSADNVILSLTCQEFLTMTVMETPTDLLLHWTGSWIDPVWSVQLEHTPLFPGFPIVRAESYGPKDQVFSF